MRSKQVKVRFVPPCATVGTLPSVISSWCPGNTANFSRSQFLEPPFPSCSCYRYYFLLALAYRREFAYLLSLRAYLNVPICVVSGSHRFNKKGDHFPLSVTSSWLLRRSMLSEISGLTLLC